MDRHVGLEYADLLCLAKKVAIIRSVTVATYQLHDNHHPTSAAYNMNCLPVWGSWLSGSYWYLQTGFILMAQDWLGVSLSRSTPLGWLERLNTALCPPSPSGLVQSNSWESRGPAGRKPNHSCTYSASVCAMFVSILLAKVSYQAHWASWSGKVNCSSFVGKYHQVIWRRMWL